MDDVVPIIHSYCIEVAAHAKRLFETCLEYSIIIDSMLGSREWSTFDESDEFQLLISLEDVESIFDSPMSFYILPDNKYMRFEKCVILKEICPVCQRFGHNNYWNNYYCEIIPKDKFVTVIEFLDAFGDVICQSQERCNHIFPEGYTVFKFAGTWCVKIECGS